MDPEELQVVLAILAGQVRILARILRRRRREGKGGVQSAVAGTGPAPAGTPAAPPPRPRSLRELIPDLLAREGPLKASTIARRLGRCNSGHFRDCLHMLVEEGKVVRVAEARYGLPGADGGPP